MNTKPVIRVCLVDDDEDYYIITRDLLAESTELTFSLVWIDNFTDAIPEIAKPDYDVFLFDYQIGKDNGIDLLQALVNRGIRTPVVMLTGQGDRDIDLAAMRAGAADYLVKGKVDADGLERSIRYAVEHSKTLEQLRASRDSLSITTGKLEKALSDINEELAMARLVQQSLLPHDPGAFLGVDVAATYLPSGIVGGDMYDILQIDEDRIAFLILDVCGHGVPAALITAMAKVSFSRTIFKYGSPRVIFTQVNGELYRYMPDSRYVTAFLGILDTTQKNFLFSRAGHPPVAYFSAEKQTISYLTTVAPLIGCFPDSAFEEKNIPVSTGDILVFYTDGLAECVDKSGKRFSMATMEQAIIESKDKKAKTILEAITKAVTEFVGGEVQGDDVTVMVVKVG